MPKTRFQFTTKLAVFFLCLLFGAGLFSFAHAQTDLPKGGVDFKSATKLDVGSYSYDEARIGEDESRYFLIDGLAPGRLLRVEGSMDNEVEAQWMKFRLYNEEREELTYFNLNRQELNSLAWLPSTEEGDHEYYLEIKTGAEYGGEDVAFSFDLEKEDRFDAGSDTDAGEKTSEAVAVATGTYEAYFAGEDSGSDYIDYYKTDLDKGETLQVKAIPSSEMGVTLWLYNSDREELIREASSNSGAITEFSFTPTDAGEFYLQIDCRGCDHSIDQESVTYEFELTKEKASEDVVALKEAGLSDSDIETMRENLSEEEFEAKKKEILGEIEEAEEAMEDLPSEEEMEEKAEAVREGIEESKKMIGFGIFRGIFALLKFVIFGLVGLVVLGIIIYLLVRNSKNGANGGGDSKGPMEKGKEMMPGKKSGAKGKTESGLDPNVAAALSYVLGIITGVIFLVIEKDNQFVRFHALQSIFFGLALMVVSWIPILGWFIFLPLGMIVGIFLIIKAYQGKRYKLPVIGDFVEKQIEK